MKTIILLTLVILALNSSASEEKIGLATYYTTKSCQREGTSGVFTANGERFNEQDFTCAMRSRKWNSRFKVTNLENGKSIEVRTNDYGPNARCAKRGVIIDLTPAGWEALGLKPIGAKNGRGEVKVKVEEL